MTPEIITPEKAQELLNGSPLNRPLNEAMVARYKDDILNGRFRLATDDGAGPPPKKSEYRSIDAPWEE